MKRKLLVLVGTAAASVAVSGVAAAGSSPTVTTGKATGVTRSGASLFGTVNPNGSSTTYYFQWGLSPSYGFNGSPLAAGHGTVGRTVHESAGALESGTVYHYRIVATNQFGTTVGADRSFKTAGNPPPQPATGPALQVNTTGAELTGAVYPEGAATTWYFQWGTTNAYGQQTTAGQTAATNSPQLVASSLEGLLAPGTIYHFRLAATHGGSVTTYGPDATFMTHPSPAPEPRIAASTKPSFTSRRPYVLTTTGTVTPPASIPAQYGCNGNVTIRFFDGPREIAFTLAGIQPNCTFAAKTTFGSLPSALRGRRGTRHREVRLRIVVRSLANSYLATNSAPLEHVTLVG
jgi:hypothetical protein